MIARRFAAQLQQRDWLGVGIELALVVLGVFLGIQVANWNESRKESALEASYFARIAEDVRADVAEMDEIIRVAAVRMALLNEVLPKASRRPLPDGFDSARGRVAIETVPAYADAGSAAPGFALFILTPLEGNRSAYETMIHAGALAGIHDAATLRRVQDYSAAVDRVRHFEVALERSRDELVDAQRRAGHSPVSEIDVPTIVSAFATSPELLASGENYWLYTNRHLKLVRALQAQARELASSLGAKP